MSGMNGMSTPKTPDKPQTPKPTYKEWWKSFDEWWHYEGSKPPEPGVEMEEHVRTMCRIAWMNGTYKERHSLGSPSHWTKDDIAEYHKLHPPIQTRGESDGGTEYKKCIHCGATCNVLRVKDDTICIECYDNIKPNEENFSEPSR